MCHYASFKVSVRLASAAAAPNLKSKHDFLIINNIFSYRFFFLKRTFHSFTEAKQQFSKNIVLIEGVRTPFLPSFGAYKTLMAYELARNSLL